MFKKTIIAATALVASFVAFQPVEQAEARVNVHIGLGGGHYGGHGYYGGSPYYGGHSYYTPRRSYRKTCGQVRRKLRNRGYYRIRSVDCSGTRYTFHAKRHGEWFRIRVKSRSGYIYKVRYL